MSRMQWVKHVAVIAMVTIHVVGRVAHYGCAMLRYGLLRSLDHSQPNVCASCNSDSKTCTEIIGSA